MAPAGTPLWQRFLAALVAYLLPFAEAIPFGDSLLQQYPVLQMLALPAVPIIFVQELGSFGVGFSGAISLGRLLLFSLLYLPVVRSPRMPYVIRFHVMQAILIDIVLIFFSIIFLSLPQALQESFLARALGNAIFLGVLVLGVFSLVQSMRGKEVEIPALSEAVRMQL